MDAFSEKVRGVLSDTMNLPDDFLNMIPQYVAQNPVPTTDRSAGYEIGYDQITSGVNITGLTIGGATTIIAGTQHFFNGNPVVMEFFSPQVTTPTAAAGNATILALFEGGTALADIGKIVTPAAATMWIPFCARYRFSPTAGAHTYSIKAYATSTTGTPSVQAGAGGSDVNAPAYIRFTKV